MSFLLPALSNKLARIMAKINKAPAIYAITLTASPGPTSPCSTPRAGGRRLGDGGGAAQRLPQAGRGADAVTARSTLEHTWNWSVTFQIWTRSQKRIYTSLRRCRT